MSGKPRRCRNTRVNWISAILQAARSELPTRGRHVMALQLRPNCEYCDRDLPANSPSAWICTYECTFCADCVEQRLHNVCPNCGGSFAPRRIRPAIEWRPGLSLEKRPASVKRVHLSYSLKTSQPIPCASKTSRRSNANGNAISFARHQAAAQTSQTRYHPSKTSNRRRSSFLPTITYC